MATISFYPYTPQIGANPTTGYLIGRSFRTAFVGVTGVCYLLALPTACSSWGTLVPNNSLPCMPRSWVLSTFFPNHRNAFPRNVLGRHKLISLWGWLNFLPKNRIPYCSLSGPSVYPKANHRLEKGRGPILVSPCFLDVSPHPSGLLRQFVYLITPNRSKFFVTGGDPCSS